MSSDIHLEVSSKLPTAFGEFQMRVYRCKGKEHAALYVGKVEGAQDVLCRVHSECLTGEVFHSLRCDCKEQLDASLQTIARRGVGVVIYLRQEGRGIGLVEKMKAYNLQYEGMDTVEANEHLGHRADDRDFSVAARIIRSFGIRSVELMTNNPKKIAQLESHGVVVASRVPLVAKNITEHNKAYLETKAKKLRHML